MKVTFGKQTNTGCFIAGTLVPTSAGYKEIQEIEVGDQVLSENPETDEKGYKEVKTLYPN